MIAAHAQEAVALMLAGSAALMTCTVLLLLLTALRRVLEEPLAQMACTAALMTCTVTGLPCMTAHGHIDMLIIEVTCGNIHSY